MQLTFHVQFFPPENHILQGAHLVLFFFAESNDYTKDISKVPLLLRVNTLERFDPLLCG